MEKKKIKVAVGMSGGVDSSVAAALLKEQGYEVTGVHLECWDEPGCKVDPNRKDALRVGLKLGIKMKVLDLRKEYEKRVIKWFYEELRKGRTPNPDVVCNREIKFGLFLDWAMKQGFEYIATGHYARLRDGRLLMGVDKKKDQTYFLGTLNKRQLDKVMFPVGEMIKDEVRQEAKRRGLHVWSKKGSSGICFIGDKLSFQEFLKQRVKEHEGEVVSMKGEVIGVHKGIEFYTIGQRHGFKVKQRSDKDRPWYVMRKEAKENRLVVGRKKDLQRREFEVEEWQWIGGRRSKGKIECRIRHGGRLIGCEIKGRQVRLDKAEQGIAEGQVAVIYKGEECLGGGVIS